MRFCRHKNYGFALFARKGGRGGLDFVGGIRDRRFEDVNRFRRHSFVNQNELVVMVLAGEGNAHLFQSLAGFRRMGNPDFRRVSLPVKFRSLDGSQRHSAAENDDRSGFYKRVFHYQPTADAKEDHDGKRQAPTANGVKNAPGTGTRPGYRCGVVRSCHWGTGACYPAPSKWSMRVAQPTNYDDSIATDCRPSEAHFCMAAGAETRASIRPQNPNHNANRNHRRSNNCE